MATDVTFVTNVDLSNNELRNAKAQVLATDPTGVEGKFIYNSTDKQLKFYNGTAWVPGGAQVANLSGQASAFGQSAANGSAATAARSDHYHALPAHDAAAHSAIKLSDLAAPTSALSILDLNVEDEIVIRGVGNPANGGGGSIRTGGSRYTMVFKPRTATAAYADSDEFYYDSTDATWYTEGKFKVNGDFTVNGNIISPKATGSRTLTGTGAYVSDTIKAVDDTVRLYTRIADKVTEGTWPISIIAMIDAVEKGKITYNQVTHKWEFWGTAGTSGTPIGVGFGSSDPVNGGDLVTLNYLNTALDAKAPLASPALTGTPTAPTAAAGTNTTQVATTAFVQAAVSASAAGLDVKQSVRLGTPGIGIGTYNSTGGAKGRGQFTAAVNIVDGVSLAAGDRILVGSSNFSGIWVVTTVGTGSNGVWDRATDFDDDAEVTANAFVFVEEGATYADTGWVLITNNPITIGGASGTTLEWTQFSGAGVIGAGAGLGNTGNTLFVNAGDGLEIVGDNVQIDSLVVARKASVMLTTSATSYVVTHNLGTRNVQVSIVQTGSPYGVVYTAWEATSTNTITVYFATAPAANSLRVNVVG